MAYSEEEQPLTRRECNPLAILLGLQLALLLVVSLWFFSSFENQVNALQLKLLPQAELLNGTGPQPNHVSGFIGPLYTRLAPGLAEPRPSSRSGQILVRVSNAAKIMTSGRPAGLIYGSPPNCPLQNYPIAWYLYHYRYSTGEEEV